MFDDGVVCGCSSATGLDVIICCLLCDDDECDGMLYVCDCCGYLLFSVG